MFNQLILKQPPRIGGIKVYDKNISRNEVIMDLDLFYAGDCDINFILGESQEKSFRTRLKFICCRLGGMKGGLKDFQIHG